MIITITGKPCSGKGTVGKYISKNYNFEYMCTGDMMRAMAKDLGYKDLVEFQNSKDVKDVDKTIDSNTKQIGIERINDNIIFDSRLAWHFIPNSFKVFIDIDIDTATERLMGANRENENFANKEDAKKSLMDRWTVENTRYKKIYGVDNTHMENYDLVISSKNKTPEEIGDQIMREYNKFTR